MFLAGAVLSRLATSHTPNYSGKKNTNLHLTFNVEASATQSPRTHVLPYSPYPTTVHMLNKTIIVNNPLSVIRRFSKGRPRAEPALEEV